MNQFMREAIAEARSGMLSGQGGPFGALIVSRGTIIARAHNEVLTTNDPTAHAEVLAIRRASALLGSFDLSDCEIYSSCEPCPMCFAAVHWAKIRSLYFACTRKDAAEIGFDDDYIYRVIRGEAELLQVEIKEIERGEGLLLFNEFASLEDKKLY
ncbi:MAG TPA: nucleoside deaminase [Spirochaetia bacterium]|nr:nucleoside deaminase [Spirochaetia bacterium]